MLSVGQFSINLLKNVMIRESHFISVINRARIMNSNDLKDFSTYVLTQNLTLNTTKPVTFLPKKNSVSNVKLEQASPMVVLLEYMNAQKKHIQKIADVYLNRGFNVLQVQLKPLQLLFPTRGSQVVAKDIANFLLTNESYTPLIIHGFSVGAYLWSETLVHFETDLKLYQPVINRISGQIFDSPADLEAIPTAFPASLFPQNAFIRSMFENCLRFHLKCNHNIATKHYIKSRKAFTSGLVKVPTLLMTSNVDVLSSPASVFKARDEILSQNLECYMKVFDDSKHVMHFKRYPEEYMAEIEAFLAKITQYTPHQQQLKSKL